MAVLDKSATSGRVLVPRLVILALTVVAVVAEPATTVHAPPTTSAPTTPPTPPFGGALPATGGSPATLLLFGAIAIAIGIALTRRRPLTDARQTPSSIHASSRLARTALLRRRRFAQV